MRGNGRGTEVGADCRLVGETKDLEERLISKVRDKKEVHSKRLPGHPGTRQVLQTFTMAV